MKVYSQSASFKELVFISGQISKDPETGALKRGSIEEETEEALKNLCKALEEAGSGMDCVLKVCVYLSNIEDYERMNKVYAKRFSDPKPARTCIQALIPFGMKIEIDAIAYRKED